MLHIANKSSELDGPAGRDRIAIEWALDNAGVNWQVVGDLYNYEAKRALLDQRMAMLCQRRIDTGNPHFQFVKGIHQRLIKDTLEKQGLPCDFDKMSREEGRSIHAKAIEDLRRLEPPTDPQLAYVAKLGHTGDPPANKQEAWELIDNLKRSELATNKQKQLLRRLRVKLSEAQMAHLTKRQASKRIDCAYARVDYSDSEVELLEVKPPPSSPSGQLVNAASQTAAKANGEDIVVSEGAQPPMASPGTSDSKPATPAPGPLKRIKRARDQ